MITSKEGKSRVRVTCQLCDIIVSIPVCVMQIRHREAVFSWCREWIRSEEGVRWIFAGLCWEFQTMRKRLPPSLCLSTRLPSAVGSFWHHCDEFLFRNDFGGRRRSLCVSCGASKAPSHTSTQR